MTKLNYYILTKKTKVLPGHVSIQHLQDCYQLENNQKCDRTLWNAAITSKSC